MPVLWTPNWITPASFRVPRGYTSLVVIGWQDGQFLEWDNPIRLLEFPFGGYQFVLKFYDEFWDFDSGNWELQTVFEDVYAIEPVTGNIVSAGDVSIEWRWFIHPYARPGLVLDMPAVDNHYYWSELPVSPPDYWQQFDTPLPSTPFITNP